MVGIYFDIGNNLLLVNGVLNPSGYLQANNGDRFGLIYSCQNQTFFPLILKLEIVDFRPQFSGNAHITNCGDNIYIVKLLPQSYAKMLPPDIYHQCSVDNKPTHYVTAFCQGDYYITIETGQEIITFETQCKLCNIVLKSQNISSGKLIILSADSHDDKKYLAIISYYGDYKLLFHAHCDKFNFNQKGLEIVDNIDDMLSHTITRQFAFENNNYQEKSRNFICRHDNYIIDELIGYAFIECLYWKDFDRCKRYCIHDNLVEGIAKKLGNFSTIIHKPYLKYKPNRIALKYEQAEQSYLRYFDFEISHGKIIDVTPL